jgi:uncharacterized protein (TIGR03790 family)
VVIVANKDVWHSLELAQYYMKQRNIPQDHLIKLRAPAEENCSRDDYEKYIASPIKTFLIKNDPEGIQFRCLVTMYGLPLRVDPPELTSDERKTLSELYKKYDSVREKIKKKGNQDQDNEEHRRLKEEEASLKKQIDHIRKTFQGASVDSELALVREDPYPLEGWLPNKYFLGFHGRDIKNSPQKVMLTSRLDGPSKEIVRRMIDDSLHAEKEGLQGKAYFDAQWPDPEEKELTGYRLYDRAIHQAARLVEKSQRMPVVLDSKEEVFQPGQCPDAALYCGWYRLAHYVDAFTEPYVHAFPLPNLFFGLLLEGRLTLAECYALSNPYWSWQMVLIGDPLYRPFKNPKAGHYNLPSGSGIK